VCVGVYGPGKTLEWCVCVWVSTDLARLWSGVRVCGCLPTWQDFGVVCLCVGVYRPGKTLEWCVCVWVSTDLASVWSPGIERVLDASSLSIHSCIFVHVMLCVRM